MMHVTGKAGKSGARDAIPRHMGNVIGFGQEDRSFAAGSAGKIDFPPGFFVIGAPRCGTTALCKTLARHPGISFSKPKEPHYFLELPGALSDEQVRSRYLGLYHRGLSVEHQAIGDGSISYLYFPEAIRQILRFDPRARFIVSVRNPVDLLVSYHNRLLYQLDENERDFARAWSLQGRRAAGLDIPKRCREPLMLQYGEIGQLGKRLEHLFGIVGRERCLVIVFDDLIRDPRAAYTRILGFIGLDDDGQETFRQRRETRDYRYAWLQQFVMNPPSWLMRNIDFSNIRLLEQLKKIRKRVKKFNTRPPAQRAELSDEMLGILREYFADDVHKLSGLLGRDLAHWLNPGS